MSERKVVVAVYHATDRVKFWSKFGVFWGSIWGLMSGTVFFAIAGAGPVLIGGASFVAMILAAIQGGVVVGGLSAIGAGVYGICIPKDSIIQSETNLTARRFLVVGHSSKPEVAKVRATLGKRQAIILDLYALDGRRHRQDRVRKSA